MSCGPYDDPPLRCRGRTCPARRRLRRRVCWFGVRARFAREPPRPPAASAARASPLHHSV